MFFDVDCIFSTFFSFIIFISSILKEAVWIAFDADRKGKIQFCVLQHILKQLMRSLMFNFEL